MREQCINLNFRYKILLCRCEAVVIILGPILKKQSILYHLTLTVSCITMREFDEGKHKERYQNLDN